MDPDIKPLVVDPSRSRMYADQTGIFVRAQGPDGKWGSWDIACLTTQSLIDWLKSRGGSNPWAENTVLILLGHENIEGGPTYLKL